MIALSQQRIVGEKDSCVAWRFLLAEPDFLLLVFRLRLERSRKNTAASGDFCNWIRPELFASVEKTQRLRSLN